MKYLSHACILLDLGDGKEFDLAYDFDKTKEQLFKIIPLISFIKMNRKMHVLVQHPLKGNFEHCPLGHGHFYFKSEF